MMVSGVLLIGDAGATLMWQEPLSWLLAGHQQGELEDALASPPRRVIQRKPLEGDAIGRVTIPSVNVSEYVVEGTGTGDLRKGPGHYPSSPLPGERGTTAIAGHRTTYGAPFRRLDKVRRGNPITVDTPYGRFVYEVERTRIVDDTDVSVLRRVGYDRLVLTACHPLYSAAQRIVVFARLRRRGPATVRPAGS
jgi:sortase A